MMQLAVTILHNTGLPVIIINYEQNTNYAYKLDVSICVAFLLPTYCSNTKWKVFEKYMKKYLKYFSMYSHLNTFIFKKYL